MTTVSLGRHNPLVFSLNRFGRKRTSSRAMRPFSQGPIPPTRSARHTFQGRRNRGRSCSRRRLRVGSSYSSGRRRRKKVGSFNSHPPSKRIIDEAPGYPLLRSMRLRLHCGRRCTGHATGAALDESAGRFFRTSPARKARIASCQGARVRRASHGEVLMPLILPKSDRKELSQRTYVHHRLARSS